MMGNWADMTGYGVGHWLLFAAMIAAFLYPIGRILSRVGFSPFWSILAVIPVANLIALWLLAFIEWPPAERKALGSH